MWVVVACSAVPLIALLALIIARRIVHARRRDRFAQRQMTTKDFGDHVVQTATGNGSQQLALGYIHRQVIFHLLCMRLPEPAGFLIRRCVFLRTQIYEILRPTHCIQ